MHKKSIVSIKAEPTEKYKDKFTGDFVIKSVLDKDDSSEQEMYNVTFKAGCRTRPHIHASEQILIATDGKGVVVFAKRIRIDPKKKKRQNWIIFGSNDNWGYSMLVT